METRAGPPFIAGARRSGEGRAGWDWGQGTAGRCGACLRASRRATAHDMVLDDAKRGRNPRWPAGVRYGASSRGAAEADAGVPAGDDGGRWSRVRSLACWGGQEWRGWATSSGAVLTGWSGSIRCRRGISSRGAAPACREDLADHHGVAWGSGDEDLLRFATALARVRMLGLAAALAGLAALVGCCCAS